MIAATTAPRPRPTIAGHLSLCRFDHWVKNVFVLPGILLGSVALSSHDGLWWRALVGMFAVGLIASSNYILNEVLDAATDSHHPVKSLRPIPSGLVSVPLAYVQWLLFMAAGMSAAAMISRGFAVTMLALWVMGICYNVRPLRTKDVPYLDVLSESVNNPLRLLAGWYISSNPKLAPASLLVSYWMVGAYFMAAKRFAEFREIDNQARSAAYRLSFAFYDEPRLLVSIVFYAAAAMLSFGAFLARYRVEYVLSFPLVALVMALYLKISFQPHSAAQHPEYLYKEKGLMLAVVLCWAALIALTFIDVPLINEMFSTAASGFGGPAR